MGPWMGPRDNLSIACDLVANLQQLKLLFLFLLGLHGAPEPIKQELHSEYISFLPLLCYRAVKAVGWTRNVLLRDRMSDLAINIDGAVKYQITPIHSIRDTDACVPQ